MRKKRKTSCTITHFWNNSVEATSSIPEAMLARCKFTEVFRCPWDFVIKKLENNSARRFLVNRDVELWEYVKHKCRERRYGERRLKPIIKRLIWRLLTKTFDLEFDGADLEDSLSTAYSGMAEATTRPKYICLPLAAVDEKRRIDENEAIAELELLLNCPGLKYWRRNAGRNIETERCRRKSTPFGLLWWWGQAWSSSKFKFPDVYK